MSLMVLNIILLLFVVILLLLLSMVWPPDSPWAPWWRTDDKNARAASRLAEIKPTDTVYELGSGDAGFLVIAAKEYKAKCVGVEIDPLRVLISKVKINFLGLAEKIKIIKKNFFEVNLSDATVVFVYLVPKALERLRPKLLKELKPGTRIISFRYEFKKPFRKQDTRHTLYLYHASDLADKKKK